MSRNNRFETDPAALRREAEMLRAEAIRSFVNDLVAPFRRARGR